MTVRISFLGGLGDIGRNCASLEVGGKLALIDCGLMFPEEHMLGVDLVLPDFASVLSRSDDLECVVLTHGHEDHIGALPYLLAEVNVPVYGTALAVALASEAVHGYPARSLEVVGVTGTNGKTTTVALVQQAIDTTFQTDKYAEIGNRLDGAFNPVVFVMCSCEFFPGVRMTLFHAQ